MTANRAAPSTQPVEARPSPAFRCLHWTLTALAVFIFAIGLFHLDSEAFWYFSASMAVFSVVATANLIRLSLELHRNRRA